MRMQEDGPGTKTHGELPGIDTYRTCWIDHGGKKGLARPDNTIERRQRMRRIGRS